jgi:hypothetical protein
MTRTILAITVLVASLFSVAPAMATLVVDQSQLSGPYPMSTFPLSSFTEPYYYIAQSFQQSANNITGASVLTGYVSGYNDGSADVTISLFDTLPDAGGNLLASGTVVSVQAGNWAEVSWPEVAVTPNTTYYLVFSDANETGDAFGLAGDIGNPYPRGQVYVNDAFDDSNSDYDYAFKTFSTVPEPSTIILLGIGAMSLLAYVWRQRRQMA